MKQIWAPWRMEFLLADKKSSGCPFCALPSEGNDRENLILCRSDLSYIILNRYPYNNGHLMVVPFKHEKALESLSKESVVDLSTMLQRSIRLLKQAFKPDGFNVGINLDAAAGAGIPGHLHYHVVPRWVGDTNFMPILNDVKVLNEHLLDTYDRLKKRDGG